MALSTFSELKTTVQTWLDRSDFSATADDIVKLAEGHFNLELRCREMQTTTTLTPTAGVCTLPTDFLGAIKVSVNSSPKRPLVYIGQGIVDKMYDVSVAGEACNYGIIGENIHTYPQSTTDIELVYWQEVPALSDSNTSNWLLVKYPNIYLDACRMEAYTYFNDFNNMQMAAGKVDAQITRLNDRTMFEEYADAARTEWGYTP